MLRLLLPPMLLSCALAAAAQNMVLTGTQLTIAPGTRIALDGPIAWSIASDAAVENDGSIELGASATLLEVPGSPITGSGTESATRTLPGAFSALEPGGLGLTLSAENGIGDLLITRGHVPFTLNGGDASVARWFRIDAADAPATMLDLIFKYDPTELNGLDPLDLVLRHGLTTAIWGMVATVDGPGPNALSTQLPGPWGTLTAFDTDASTVTTPTEPLSVPVFALLGAPGSDLLVVKAQSDEMLNSWEVFDARGRLISSGVPLGGAAIATIPMMHVSTGLVVVRINGWSTHKWMR